MELVGDVNLIDGLVEFVLQDVRAGAFEGAALGMDVDFGIDADDFGLGQEFVFFVVALVVGLDAAALLGGEKFVADVGIQVIPSAAGDGDDEEEDERGNETWEALRGDLGSSSPTVFGAAARECDREDSEHGHDREPIDDGPSESGDEMAVAVHVAVGVGGSLAWKIERVLETVAKQNRERDEETDDDSVADEFVADDGLNEESEEGEDEHLGIGDDEKFLEVLGDFEVVVAGEGLHEDAANHGDGEEDEFGDGEREELAEPVGGLAHGERVVDAVEMRIALAPDEFSGVERRDDEEKESRGAFDGLHHEKGDRPDVAAGDASGEVAVVDGEGDQKADERPERDFVKDVGETKFCERDELAPGCGGAEDLADDRQLGGDDAPFGAGIFLFEKFCFGGAALAADGG